MSVKPALFEALKIAQEQIKQIKLKKVEIQITPEELQALDEASAKSQKNVNYITRILSEISKPLTNLLDEYQLEKCYSSLIRCIEYCQTEKLLIDAI